MSASVRGCLCEGVSYGVRTSLDEPIGHAERSGIGSQQWRRTMAEGPRPDGTSEGAATQGEPPPGQHLRLPLDHLASQTLGGRQAPSAGPAARPVPPPRDAPGSDRACSRLKQTTPRVVLRRGGLVRGKECFGQLPQTGRLQRMTIKCRGDQSNTRSRRRDVSRACQAERSP